MPKPKRMKPFSKWPDPYEFGQSEYYAIHEFAFSVMESVKQDGKRAKEANELLRGSLEEMRGFIDSILDGTFVSNGMDKADLFDLCWDFVNDVAAGDMSPDSVVTNAKEIVRKANGEPADKCIYCGYEFSETEGRHTVNGSSTESQCSDCRSDEES